MENKAFAFRRLGTMLDCSRNAVMTVKSVKKWIDITADLGYNTLMLYTEDTYEVAGEPYFGYAQGRYSREELKEVNAYAASRGMELIPCIQTLAHLNAITRWPEYVPHIDVQDILLAGDERSYELIEHMFETIADCFTSKYVHIGMDEAHLFGRGRYYDLHGDTDRTEAMLDHLNRVAQIGARYGLSLIMWSDMFYRLAAGGEYYAAGADIDRDVGREIPDNVELVYWDYYSTEAARYDGMLRSHAGIKPGTWFAGGLWTWEGFAPHNGYGVRTVQAALEPCRANKAILDFFVHGVCPVRKEETLEILAIIDAARQARLLLSTSYTKNLECAAFENPDGERVAVILNQSDWPQRFALLLGEDSASVSLEAHSIMTAVIK